MNLRLYIVCYFCYLLKKMIYKNSLVFDLLFKLKIGFGFVKKISKAKK